jgi:hypothetical protein
VVGVAVGEMPELLRLVEAPLQVLRGHEVLRHFYTVVDVPHLGDTVIKSTKPNNNGPFRGSRLTEFNSGSGLLENLEPYTERI